MALVNMAGGLAVCCTLVQCKCIRCQRLSPKNKRGNLWQYFFQSFIVDITVFKKRYSEELQLYSQVQNLTIISNGTLNTISLNAFFFFLLNGSYFSGHDPGILKEEVKTYLMTSSSPLNSIFSSAHL